jgi:hypothetical protein
MDDGLDWILEYLAVESSEAREQGIVAFPGASTS